MLFTAPEFAVFVAITFGIYYLPFSRGIQLLILLAASFVFYSWTAPILLLLLLASILLNAITSFQVMRVQPRHRLAWAAGGVIANLVILGTFKYGALLTNLVVNAFGLPRTGALQTLLQLPLPIGISFYTFEGISLVIDVLHHRIKDSKGTFEDSRESFLSHLAKTSFFVAFFPHLIAGPILKANHFFPQIGPKRIQAIPWVIAFRALLTGYFLKMVVADNLKDYTFWIAYPYYLGLGTINGLVLLFAYSIQIFADFAGYSLIAIGLAALFGYTLPPNFEFPYISRSISEFWRRWHISLSTWLRDYLYIPLGGNRKGVSRTYINLLIVMSLGGLWHGAAWSYMLWGCYHGGGLALERFYEELRRKKSPAPRGAAVPDSFFLATLRTIAVFAFVSLGWLLFKLPDFSQVLEYLAMLTRGFQVVPNPTIVAAIMLFCAPVVLYHLLHVPAVSAWLEASRNRHRLVLDIGYETTFAAMLVLVILNGGTSNAFIYFQF